MLFSRTIYWTQFLPPERHLVSWININCRNIKLFIQLSIQKLIFDKRVGIFAISAQKTSIEIRFGKSWIFGKKAPISGWSQVVLVFRICLFMFFKILVFCGRLINFLHSFENFNVKFEFFIVDLLNIFSLRLINFNFLRNYIFLRI